MTQHQATGLPLDEASVLVAEASQRLWDSEGRNALVYLHHRGLNDETIKARGLGWVRDAMIPTRDGDRRFLFSGVTIPWRDGDRLTRVKIRRISNGEPRYAEAFSDRPLIYPSPGAIRVGEPLVVCEGEFDAMLLGQELPEASVITLGSASAGPTRPCLSRCSPPLAGSSLWMPIRPETPRR